MRIRFALGGLAAALALSAGPASAQVQQLNPNAANESFALQSQFRTLQQQRVSDYNTLNMQAQRNVQFNPPAAYLGEYGIVGRPAHRGRLPRARHGFNTSICTGC